MENLQSIAAIGIVFLTLSIFLYKMLRKNKDAENCGSSCHCSAKSLVKKPKA